MRYTANELESYAVKFNGTMRQLENEIMADIIRRIKINGEITRSADWQIHRLHELGESKRAIKKHIKKALNLSSQEVNHLFKDIIRKGYAEDEKIYKYKGKPFISFEDNKQLQQLITAVAAQTHTELKNITQSLGFAVKQPDGTLKFTELADYYQRTLDNATLSIATGAFGYNTILKRTVAELTNSGLRTVDYASGWSNRVDVATRRAVMTGFNQIVAKVNDDNAQKLGTNYFEVSWHGGARPTHQLWQGRVYSKEELATVCGLGEVTGLCGANCYHSYYPFFPEISERTYTDEQLEKMNRQENIPIEYNGKQYTKYEALQRQRRLETTMRAQRQRIKLLKEGGAIEDDIITARGRYRVTSSEYTRFSETMNLPQQRERVTIDGLGNIGQGKYKTDLTNKSYNDIIHMKGKMSDIEVRKWYKAHDKTIPDLIDKSLSIEQQAKQACDLRNRFRTQARNLMSNQEKRKELDITDPNKSFEELIKDKMDRKGLSRLEAIEDILKTATKTRKSVDKKFGLE